MEFKELFRKDFSRNIETVIKADDQTHIYQEVDEYVMTNEITTKLADFFEQYTDYEGANGVWISGFFGSGKSHLLKILGYVLENKTLNDTPLGELFAEKVTGDAKLKGDILAGTRIPSESILFNVDQQAQITAKTDENAILQVFYKVLYEHQGFYGFQPHVAEFERWLYREQKYDAFKVDFEKAFGKAWVNARQDYVDPMIEDAIAIACEGLFNNDSSRYEGILDKFEDTIKFSIEDFAHKVNEYIQTKPDGFRLNFFVDEVGQYIANNTRLMLNLQTIAESLATKCKGRSWIIVTSQEDLESIVGDDTVSQSDDFSKIQGRFRIRVPLTSANVDEVIEKRLLEKSEHGVYTLTATWQKEKDNLTTLLSFSEAGIQFKNYRDGDEFVAKYPFIPHHFDLFQQCIKALSRHNAFQGKHASVGERSMLGVFQEVLKDLDGFNERGLVSFDQLFEGLRATMRTEIQNSIIVAERQLSGNPLAVRILKALFLVKYYDSFKTTLRNVSVLMLNNLDINPNTHQKEVEEALNLLEQQSYIQRKGETFEFLTDVEKDIEEEIKATDFESGQVTDLYSTLLFDGIIKDSRLQYIDNRQLYEFTRKVDGVLYGREKELTIELVTPSSDKYDDEYYFQGLSMGNQTHMLLKLAHDDRTAKEAKLHIQTDKYIKQNQSTSNDDGVKRILYEKGQQNQERKREMLKSLDEMLAGATVYLNGTVHKVSSTSDGQTKVIKAFQDLVKLAYSKLKLLGDVNFDESRLQSIMRSKQDDLFGTDEASLTPAEGEMLDLIRRRKMMNDRTSLTDLKDHFSKKPYGWPDNAVWCIAAMLFKRGKIEARQDSNNLEDPEFLNALMNNRSHSNTLVLLQIEFDQRQIRQLKEVHKEVFNESNPNNEAKEVAFLFKEKAAEELDFVNRLIAQQQAYPFIAQLMPLSDVLRKIREMDYATLITEIGDMKDELLNIKEDLLDPIKQFMNSGQKDIYDRLREFQSWNQANFNYVNSEEKNFLNEVQEHATPFRGNLMKDAKQAMDDLENRVKNQLLGERDHTIERIKEQIKELKKRKEFASLEAIHQQQVLAPLEQELKRAGTERYIGNLRDQRNRLGNLYADQLNQMIALTGPEEMADEQPQFIKQSNIHITYGKRELETEADVDDYLREARHALVSHINKNRRILLDNNDV